MVTPGQVKPLFQKCSSVQLSRQKGPSFRLSRGLTQQKQKCKPFFQADSLTEVLLLLSKACYILRRVRRTSDSPEHWEVPAVGDSGGIGETVLPQVGPVPGHLDDEGASLSAELADPPEVHRHGAQHKQPPQRRDQEAEYLDQAFPHC